MMLAVFAGTALAADGTLHVVKTWSWSMAGDALTGGSTTWTAPVSNWASILLEKKDLAKHLGKSYTLEPVRYAGTPPMITALATGELEVANLAYSTLGIAIKNAGLEDLRVIADAVSSTHLTLPTTYSV